jgi:hypothetical protein
VKYTQCVKIWLFDVLVLFLMCVQFLKPCVQFLMDTILNLIIVQFLVKKKGDMLLLHVSHISGKGRHTICGRISILLSCIKKDCQQKFSTGSFLHRTPVPVWTHAACGAGEATWSTSCF